MVNFNKEKINSFSNKLLIIILSLGVYFGYLSTYSNILNSNEWIYIGEIFKSNSNYSAYQGNTSEIDSIYFFTYLIKIFLLLFESNFLISLEILIGFMLIFFVIKFFELFKININLIPLFIYLFLKFNLDYFAGTFMFLHVEPKTIGYLFFIGFIYFFLWRYLN